MGFTVSSLGYFYYHTFEYEKSILSLKVCTQPAIACSKLTIETLEQGVKYVQS